MTLARFVIRAKAFRFRGEEGWLRSRLINIRAIKVLPRRLALDCGCENDPLRGILARYVTRQPQFTQRGTSLCSRGDESCPRFDGVKTGLDLGVQSSEMSAGIDTHGGKDRRCHVETICSRRRTRQEIKVNRDDLFSDIVCRQCRFNVRENAFWMRSKNALNLCYRASSFVSEFDVEYLIIARWFYSWINIDKL